MTNFEYLVEHVSLLLMYPTDECVVWPYHYYVDGYARTAYKGRMLSVSRLTLELVYGHEIEFPRVYFREGLSY
jgi:hypothetical protein